MESLIFTWPGEPAKFVPAIPGNVFTDAPDEIRIVNVARTRAPEQERRVTADYRVYRGVHVACEQEYRARALWPDRSDPVTTERTIGTR